MVCVLAWDCTAQSYCHNLPLGYQSKKFGNWKQSYGVLSLLAVLDSLETSINQIFPFHSLTLVFTAKQFVGRYRDMKRMIVIETVFWLIRYQRVYEITTATATAMQCCFCFRNSNSKNSLFSVRICFPSKTLKFSSVFPFHFTTCKPHFSRSVLQVYTSEVKFSRFKCLSSKKQDGFQASRSYRRPHFGLFDYMLKVVYENKSCFAKYQMTFWLELQSWFRKLCITILL